MATVEFLQALHHPACYPHAVQKIEFLETPETWIILTGQFVYKLKKPLTFKYNDLSTVEARYTFLLEECRLHKIFTPHSTSSIVNITSTPKIGGDTSIIDHALQLPQLPLEVKFSHLLQAGTLYSFHIDILARQLAQCHARLPTLDKPSLSIYQQVMQGNVTPFYAKNLPTDINYNQLRQLTDSLLTLFKQYESNFQTRTQQGFVRDCHGNLRLDNLAFVENEVVILGSRATDSTLRWMDVLSELSGLLVDLEYLQALTLAARFLNIYLEYTGNYTGLPLLRFYQAYQAFSRAKIVIYQLSKQKNSTKEILTQQYQTYIALLERYLQPRTLPVLILTYGVSGSGKSTVTQLLLEAIGAIRLRSDVERKRLFGLDFLERNGAERGLYDLEISQMIFKGLETLARHILQARFSVIIDATFLQRAGRTPFRRLAHTLNIPCVILACSASEENLFQRVLLRQQKDDDPSDADINVLKQQLAIKESFGTDEQVISVNTDQPLEIAEIVRKLHSIISFNPLSKG